MVLPKLTTVKEKRVLTLWGWFVVLLLMTGFGYGVVLNLYPFLAVNAPVKAEILVVEGFLSDRNLKHAAEEFSRGGYRIMATTGGPLGHGTFLTKYHSYAQLSAETLKALGMDPLKLISIESPPVRKDRTYASAKALKKELERLNFPATGLNIITASTHARRSRLLFQKALGDSMRVGVIRLPAEGFNEDEWWKSSAGVRSVINESIAYIYARFLFRPETS